MQATRASQAARVLVVDDEPSIVDIVSAALRLAGFDVEAAADGVEALRLARGGRFDAIVLDVMLPGRDGFEVCRRLRAEHNLVPVLFLTARTDSTDATEGLTIGGDDYVRKPFHLEELVARVRALVRRRSQLASNPDVLAFGDVTVDLLTFESRQGQRHLELTPTEFRLLEVLVRNGGRILTRAQLVELVWEMPDAVDTASVETVISRLRRKLDDERCAPVSLVTRRGVGYGLMPTPDPRRVDTATS